MIARERSFEEELADVLVQVRVHNPRLTTVHIVAVEPLDSRFQKWIVGAYPTRDLALGVACAEYSQYPINTVDTTVQEVNVARKLAHVVGQAPVKKMEVADELQQAA